MCGRFTLRAPASQIAEQFAVFDMPDLKPRFNIAPTQPVPVLRLRPSGDGGGSAAKQPGGRGGHGQTSGEAGPPRELVLLHWGLIPHWAKDPAIGNRMINARSETVAEKPAYKAALRRRRCLVLADGFYEWKKTSSGKQPYFFHLADDRPFAFAGLWESWEGPDHSYIESCTLLTGEPNEVVRPIHDRMPVILAPDEYPRWLDPTIADIDRLSPLLAPYPAAEMRARAVSRAVNSPRTDDPRCIEPVEA